MNYCVVAILISIMPEIRCFVCYFKLLIRASSFGSHFFNINHEHKNTNKLHGIKSSKAKRIINLLLCLILGITCILEFNYIYNNLWSYKAVMYIIDLGWAWYGIIFISAMNISWPNRRRELLEFYSLLHLSRDTKFWRSDIKKLRIAFYIIIWMVTVLTIFSIIALIINETSSTYMFVKTVDFLFVPFTGVCLMEINLENLMYNEIFKCTFDCLQNRIIAQTKKPKVERASGDFQREIVKIQRTYLRITNSFLRNAGFRKHIFLGFVIFYSLAIIFYLWFFIFFYFAKNYELSCLEIIFVTRFLCYPVANVGMLQTYRTTAETVSIRFIAFLYVYVYMFAQVNQTKVRLDQ